MRFLDKAKDLIGDHKEQIDAGIEKAEDLIESKTPDSVDDKVEMAGNKIQEVVKKLD